MSELPTVYLIDASIYVFRAWFSLPASLTGHQGQPVNAAYGFSRFLAEFCDRSQARHVGIAFDESLTSSFRNDLYKPYKMNRELPPSELKQQFSLCRKIATAAGFHCVSHDRYEADDLIATMAHNLRAEGFRIAIVSGDKDLTQIIRARDFWWDFARNQRLDAAGVADKFGVPPAAIPDFLGLCGDAVDNIPGVPGVGPKTAVTLLQRYGSIESVYAHLDDLRVLPLRGAKGLKAKLRPHQEQALLSKKLATVCYTAPISPHIDALARHHVEWSALQDISRTMGGRGDGLFTRLAQTAPDQ